jgi:ABC-type Zn uptake system ZnuABC Zn-binding protein ZnuA
MRLLCIALAILLVLGAGTATARSLRVVATNSDLGDLVATVGGNEVEVTVLAKGPQDPHFIEPRPSFVRALHRADLFVQQGMQLEIGWAPALQRSARNPDIAPGGEGFVDASTAIVPFAERYAAFARRLIEALVGAEYAAGRSTESVVLELEGGVAVARPATPMGGWLGRAQAKPGLVGVQDHRLWPYFAGLFGLRLIETLEPKPGIAPTTRHLSRVVERMESEGASLILSCAYFDPRHAGFIAQRTGARVAEMAHQVGSREGTGDYIAVIEHNVTAVFGAP